MVRHETTIPAPLERVWALQTDVDSAVLAGPPVPGSSFRWSTGGLDITSTFLAVDPPHLLVWSGPARGVFGVHRWVFEAGGDGVHVTTEESWSGAVVDADPAAARSLLDDHLARWLAELGRAATGSGAS